MTNLGHALTLALLHFVWQGTLVAALLWIALATLRNRPGNTRYVLSCAALTVLLVLPAVTAYVVYDGSAPVSAVTVTGRGALPAALRRHPADAVISSRASGSVSSRPIAANRASTLASDNDRSAFRAQSRNLAAS